MIGPVTVVLALQCADGVVLAADPQITEPERCLRQRLGHGPDGGALHARRTPRA
jgi:hypothetical protein